MDIAGKATAKRIPGGLSVNSLTADHPEAQDISALDPREGYRAGSVAGFPRWDPRQWAVAVAVVGISAAASGLLWFCTARFGIGVENDSAVYIAGARHWLSGYGISWISGGMQVKPIVHYPPLFSLLLAGLNGLSIDVLLGG